MGTLGITKSPVKVLDEYLKAFRDLINEKNFSTSMKIKDALHLCKDEDWAFIVSSMDIIGDASMAIENFLQFGVDGPTKYEKFGEKYLRLYGMLNAVYLQQQAVMKLYLLMNVPNPKAIEKKIKLLKIIEIRHKLGAHSTNYHNPNTNTIQSYVPVRMSLSGFNCTLINNEDLTIGYIDLKESLEEYLNYMIELLDTIYEKASKTFYKSNKMKLTELKERLEQLRIVKAGGDVINLADGGELIIHTLGTESRPVTP